MAEHPIIFFDGICNLCNSAVQFVIERDKKKRFKFAALQGEFAEQTLKVFTLGFEQRGSFVLLENGKVYEQSTAALRVAKKLSGLWAMLYIFIIIPPFIRNAVYRFVALNRYKWFGMRDTCSVPRLGQTERFYS